jgi:hypothetical protein
MLEHLNSTPQRPGRVVVLGAYGFVRGNCARLLAARAEFRCFRSTRTTST